jgi:hypothetical protein
MMSLIVIDAALPARNDPMFPRSLSDFKMHWQRNLALAVSILLGVFILIQLIPIDRTNPPVIAEPNWDSPQTRDLVARACFDCHSNETDYPWYSKVAPMSLLVAHDVEEGRSKLNFSEWGSFDEADELLEVIQEGEMPPLQYKLIHPDSRLSDDEKALLEAGLKATLAKSGVSADELNEEGEEGEDD